MPTSLVPQPGTIEVGEAGRQGQVLISMVQANLTILPLTPGELEAVGPGKGVGWDCPAVVAPSTWGKGWLHLPMGAGMQVAGVAG